jgi:5-carboxymethyl-2-hydroxymuconate isomerase
VPHIILRSSQNLPPSLNISEVLAKLVAALASCDTIDSPSIKAYHQPVEIWVMGAGAREGFVHCEVSLLSGREILLRQEISAKIFEVMRQEFEPLGSVGITVEVREMNRESFNKL